MVKEEKPVSYREKLVVKMLLLGCMVLAGRSFEGGLSDDLNKAITELRSSL